MSKNKKIFIALTVFIAVIVGGIVAINLHNKNKENDVDPEILQSRKYAQVRSGDEKVDGTDYVQFDAYYLRDLDGDGYAEKLRGTCRKIGTSDTLYMDLNVLTNGTLKNAKITINGKNFSFATALVKDKVISKDYIGDNTKEIVLNDVSNGTQKLIFGVVNSSIGNNINDYSVTDNSITLTGTHVADDGTETNISKTVYLTNDWYGTTQAALNSQFQSQNYDIASALDSEDSTVNVTFKINPFEVDQKLILSNSHLEIKVPELFGYKALSVTSDNSDAIVNYDSENEVATIDINAQVDESGNVTRTISRILYENVTFTYPYEAYEKADQDGFTLNVPIDATFSGYNNNGEAFSNPYVSNVAEQVVSVLYGTPKGDNAIVQITVGKYFSDLNDYVVSKEKPMNIYNNVEYEDKDDKYLVRWELYTGTQALNVPVILNEPTKNYTDKFLDTNANYTDMLNYTENVGIYFSNQDSMLGSDGYINVYDNDTNGLLHTFTSADWSKYSESNPYMYDEGVKHIRIETSNVLKSASLYVYNVKKIDDEKLTADYTEDEFSKLNEIFSYVEAKMKLEDGTYFNLDEASKYAKYIEPYSKASISIDPQYISNQETAKNVKLNISTSSDGFLMKKWSNGEFLIKYPEEIINVDINSVTSNDSNVTITGVDTYEENGNIYTKIYTSNDVEKDLNIVIDANITANPKIYTVTKKLELYYYNPAFSNYYKDYRKADVYDINSNANTDEYVGYATNAINIVAPSNILTSQTASDFDDKSSIAIAPNEAIVDKSDNTKTAKVNVDITNNYSGTISEIKIVGKIPCKGNTYQLNGSDIGSTYDTTMTQDGIILPDDLKQYATIYYSYNETVTEDINAKKNGWTTTPDDMSKVKSYLIDLGSFVLPIKDTYEYSYTIQIPNGLNYNDVAYSDHAIYYCLDTDQGKLKTQTEPNRLGFRIAKKYDLEISKYEKNTTKPVSGVVFTAQEVDSENSKSATTYSNGIATIKDLYVEREYILKEIKTNKNYILDSSEIKIKGHVVDGQLQIEVLDGKFSSDVQIESQENANIKAKVTLENEVKYNFVLNKTQTGTNDAIQGIRFELTDYNGKTRIYTTDSKGQLILKLLEPNKQYKLTEVESKGHYLKDPVTFMMVRDQNNNLKFNVISGELNSEPQIDTSGEVPVVTTGLSNEKIPTYSFKITKKETNTDTVLSGSQFKLTSENKSENVIYTTDENGQIQIDNLYQYVDGKDVTGEYTLTEIYPTEGYILNNTPLVFKAQKDDSGNLNLEIISGKVRESQVDNTDPNNPVVNVTIDNDPIFTLTKVDAETGKPLEGVEFQITDMDGKDVTDSNGNTVGIEELGKITFTSSGDYPWTKNDDGTWQSGNYNIASSTSTLSSNKFSVDEEAKISFEWSVSSESSDYLYYNIINVDTNEIIGGTSKKINGTSNGTDYSSLKYNTVEQTIQPGKYRIEFKYVKNSSGNSGLDRGYLKSISLTNAQKRVKTDSEGKIRLSLREGLYKAIETKTNEGYALPDTYTGIGIGKSKEAEYGLKVDWDNDEKERINLLCVTAVEDGVIAVAGGGQVVKYDLNGNIVWENTEKSYNYYGVTAVEDGVIAVSSNGQVVKYDLNGNIVWENTEKSYGLNHQYFGVTAVESGIVAVTAQGSVVKYDLNGNIVWENTEKKFKHNYEDVTAVEDGVIAVAGGGQVVKYDLNGNIVWENTEKSYYYEGVTTVEDGVIAVAWYGQVVKYDLNGNIVWENTEKSCIYYGVTAVEDGVIAVAGGGQVVKYDLNGNIVWENTEKSYVYQGVTTVGDGVIAVADDGQVVKYVKYIKEPEIPDSSNVVVKNEIEKYKITTKVDGYGGNISGKGQNPYEEVRYKENSTKDIIATPASGYKVQSITVNGKKIDFKENSDGTVTLDKFIEMTEDKEVVVSFIAKNAYLVINKQDSTNQSPLANAKFNIKQLETRSEPDTSQIVGNIVANGAEYTDTTINLGDQLSDFKFGDLTNNGTYYFTDNGNGGYESNNQGKSSSTANSYIQIDLTNYTGSYGLVVNANVSSESNYDFGYATVTESTTAPAYNTSSGRFIYISGTSSSVTTAKDYITNLEGRKVYYLHLGYRKDSSSNQGDDKFTVNSVKLYNANVTSETNTYYFVSNGNGGYESNNKGKASTTANSYFPIDLTNYSGKYNLVVNANVSSQSNYDYGYATVTESTTAPTYNTSSGRFIYISGTSSSVTTAKDYTTVLQGGKKYYLHVGYRKNESNDSGDDKFSVNSIKVTLNNDDFVDQDIVTNSNGDATIKLEDGKYQITEKEAPQGYTLDSTPIIYDFVSGKENTITVKNDPQVDLIVHHYIKGTTTSVAPDENIKGDLGKDYSTSPKTDLDKYQLVKNSDGSYQIPDNATGVFTKETQVVTYYYELKPLKLIVHHYIDGTEDSVAPDETSEGTEGQEYTTNPVDYPTLDEKYELVTTKLPENASGTLQDQVTEVTYYYKLKEYKITTEVDGVGGTISGQSMNPYETVESGKNSVKDIIITPDKGYEIDSIKINNVEQDIDSSDLWESESDNKLAKFENVTEDKNIVVKFKISQYEVDITKRWNDNDNSAGKRPDSINIDVYDGTNKVDTFAMDSTMKSSPFKMPPIGGKKLLEVENSSESSDDEGSTDKYTFWRTTISLPMIDSNGNYINMSDYSFVEREVNTNDLQFYDSEIYYNSDYEDHILYLFVENTFNVPDTTIDIPVTKVWSDNENANGKRPSQIKLLVKNGDTVVQEQTVDVTGNTQSYTFTGLKQYDSNGDEIQYTIDEEEVNQDDLKFYSKTIDNSARTITNTFTVPQDKISLNVEKKWQDNSNANNLRPSQIKLQVKNGDTVAQEQVVDVGSSDDATYTFNDLAKYGDDGQEINYTVDEAEVNSGDLIGYTKEVNGTVITNTIKSYKITTEVNGTGGDITGKELNPYEEVIHGNSSVKDIVITPDTGYEIKSIKINDVEQSLPSNPKETFTLDKFTNMTEDKHVVVEFKKIEYNITTEVDGEGGHISGEGKTPYETVLHGEDSVKDIIATPDSGYKITSITVNGESISFTPNTDGTYTLDKFTNMTEDKHIIVKFEKKDTSIIIKHKTKDGVNLVEPETVAGKVGDNYTTEPKEFDEYELIKDSDGNDILPDNKDGNMTEDQIEVVYIYTKVLGNITVKKVDSLSNDVISGVTFKLEKLDSKGEVDSSFTAQEKISAENGIVEFTDIGVGSYQITETQATGEYELNSKATQVSITKADRNIDVTVKDRKKLSLPLTGKINYIVVISAIGIITMTSAIVIKSKKEKDEKKL